jgi:tetratricopeptide (TPR) repeat protein
MILATALFAMLTAAPPPADDAARAKQAFVWAQKLYKQARYTEAIEKFEEAYRLKPHPFVLFNIGRCYEQLNEIPKALRSYREYLKAMPEAKDRELVSDAIVNLERRLKDQGVQQLLVYTDPPGAAVSVDGHSYGSSPSAVELHPGNHTVAIAKDGFETVERSFVVPADKSIELSFGLKVALAKPVELQAPVARSVEPPPAVPPPALSALTPNDGPRNKAWIPAVGGGALLIGAGVFYGMAKGAEGRLRSGDPTILNATDRIAVANAGQTQQTIGFALGAVGVAALVAAGTMFFWPSPKIEGTTLTVSAAPNQAAAVISGALP